MPLQPGDQLGPYEILAPLGAGGMGEVYKALDTRLERVVAVKRLNSRHSARFEQEARAIAALNHPHICQIHDIGPDYLVLEYIEGQPLKGPQPVDEAVRMGTQIAQALEAAHRKGVIHRDLKPANIMVTPEGVVKLLDFGLAKQVAQSDDTETIEGIVMGTAGYMSPEQARGEPLDARSDIFSFGAVLYELLSGRRAFRGENSMATIAAILHTEPGPLGAAPAALEAIVTLCLAKRAEDRFQNMTEVKYALEQVVAGPSTQPLSTPRQPSIAVLPFANLGGDKENEYFSDGLAEEIINFLAQIPGLKVTARTSAFAFKGKTEDIRTIAGTLGVANILEGSVRRSGSRLRVTAQLINAGDGYHLWSQRYDRQMADLFDLQDEIAQSIVSALEVKLSGTLVPLLHHRPSLPAYEALLKARHYVANYSSETPARIKECYEQAIALDPEFAQARSEYGNYFLGAALAGALPVHQAMPAIRFHAQKALELDPSLADGQAMLGMAAFLDFDWKESEKRFGLALAREPVLPYVRFLYAVGYLVPVGRPDEAVRQMDLAVQQDPLNSLMRFNRASCLAADDRHGEVEQVLREALELNPAMHLAYLALGVEHLLRGDLEEAVALVEKAYAVMPASPQILGALAGLLTRTGDLTRAEELLRKLQPSDSFGVPRGLAIYHWVLREFDAVADWFEKAIGQHDPYAVVYLRNWYGRELRSTPRWAALMGKLNLPVGPVAPVR